MMNIADGFGYRKSKAVAFRGCVRINVHSFCPRNILYLQFEGFYRTLMWVIPACPAHRRGPWRDGRRCRRGCGLRCYVEKFFAAEILAWLVIAVIGRCVGSAWLSSDVVSPGLPEHEASVSESCIMAVAQSVRVALHTLLSCDLCVMAIVWKSEHELAVCAAVA